MVDIFGLYKPFRNKLSELARDESLRAIWAYAQFLQLDRFDIPGDIEVDKKFIELDVQQRWISEWELELLAKEVILYCGAVSKIGASLKSWKTLSDTINRVKDLESEIYKRHGDDKNILIELIRIAHRQFEWQGNPPNQRTLIRYFKVFNTPEIDVVCQRLLGLSIWEAYACALATMGFFIDRDSIQLPIKSSIPRLPAEKFSTYLSLFADDIGALKRSLRTAQKYDESFPYAFNPLRARPLVIVAGVDRELAICPVPTLVYWRVTSGLFYDLMADAGFGQLFGDSYQKYVGDVVSTAAPKLTLLPEQKYVVGQNEKRSVDWIVADAHSALFIECKTKRLTWDAKQNLNDLAALEADLRHMADAVIQVYKTIRDCLDGHYPHFSVQDGRRIFPAVVTLENWHMHGPVMYDRLHDLIIQRLREENLPMGYLEDMPYSIWPISSLENGLQILDGVPIAEILNAKLKDKEFRLWEWDSFLGNKFKGHKVRALFSKEYDDLFSELRLLTTATGA